MSFDPGREGEDCPRRWWTAGEGRGFPGRGSPALGSLRVFHSIHWSCASFHGGPAGEGAVVSYPWLSAHDSLPASKRPCPAGHFPWKGDRGGHLQRHVCLRRIPAPRPLGGGRWLRSRGSQQPSLRWPHVTAHLEGPCLWGDSAGGKHSRGPKTSPGGGGEEVGPCGSWGLR